MIGLYVFAFFAAFILHGKPRDNFHAANTLISTFISAILLTAGGFWSAFPGAAP
jgi:hypothetical protein